MNYPTTRTVYTLIRYPWDDPQKPIPSDLSDAHWRPWIGCKSADVDSGLIAGLAAHRAFWEQGGPNMFRKPEGVSDFQISVILFDPEAHSIEAGTIKTAHSTDYRFLPK